jgi:hypothetical protein
MKKILQIVSACGWEAVFFSYDDGELFREPVVCWALMSERPYVENGEDEERYLEGQVLINNGNKISGVYDSPENIGFLGYLYSKLPERKIKQRMDYFRDQVEQLIVMKSGHLPNNKNLRWQKGQKEKKR